MTLYFIILYCQKIKLDFRKIKVILDCSKPMLLKKSDTIYATDFVKKINKKVNTMEYDVC